MKVDLTYEQLKQVISDLEDNHYEYGSTKEGKKALKKMKKALKKAESVRDVYGEVLHCMAIMKTESGERLL